MTYKEPQVGIEPTTASHRILPFVRLRAETTPRLRLIRPETTPKTARIASGHSEQTTNSLRGYRRFLRDLCAHTTVAVTDGGAA